MAKKIEDAVPQGSMKIRFTRNTPYNGVDYGPDYEEDTAIVDNRQAHVYIERGRAVEVEAKPSEKSD